MKVLVAYMSQTGNTKKVAEAIYDAVDAEKEIRKVTDVATLEGYDLTFLGFPVHGEGPDKKEETALKTLCNGGKRVALFITHAAPESDGEGELQGWLARFREAAAGAEIVGTFDCQGQLSKSLKFFMSIMPSAKLRRWAKMDNSQGQPDQQRLQRARKFCKDTMSRLEAKEFVGTYSI